MDFTNDTAMAGGHASLATYEAASDTAQCMDAILGKGDLIDQNVPLASLRLDCGTQLNAVMNDAAIAEYTEATRSQEFIERARDVVYWKTRGDKAEKLLGKAA
jgi:hypothetical protein